MTQMLSISLTRAGYVERMGDVKWQRTDAQKKEGKGGEEDQECDGGLH